MRSRDPPRIQRSHGVSPLSPRRLSRNGCSSRRRLITRTAVINRKAFNVKLGLLGPVGDRGANRGCVCLIYNSRASRGGPCSNVCTPPSFFRKAKGAQRFSVIPRARGWENKNTNWPLLGILSPGDVFDDDSTHGLSSTPRNLSSLGSSTVRQDVASALLNCTHRPREISNLILKRCHRGYGKYTRVGARWMLCYRACGLKCVRIYAGCWGRCVMDGFSVQVRIFYLGSVWWWYTMVLWRRFGILWWSFCEE